MRDAAIDCGMNKDILVANGDLVVVVVVLVREAVAVAVAVGVAGRTLFIVTEDTTGIVCGESIVILV